jgi:hypothetical protein
MKPIEHHGWFERGKLKCDSFTHAIREFKNRDVPVVLTVKEYKPTRSGQQNRYYWGVVVDLIYRGLNDSGIDTTREGTHELLRYRYLKEDRPIGIHGEFITTIRSTTELDTREFNEYIERCAEFASEYLNVVIPEPNEQMEIAA